MNPGLQITSLISQFAWIVVLFALAMRCLVRISSQRPREGWYAILAIGILLLPSLPVLICSDGFKSFGFKTLGMVQALKNGCSFLGFAHNLMHRLFEAIAWGLILYAAFGPGSGPTSRYLIEDDPDNADSAKDDE